ncbi:MAG: hypothetical protein A2252_09705 [Elusimicrobia bacterium RIFOXYA2_FULL_39_19]|nr:MAG: hypothetical protein A2252_09705 [Elusimicrobia bacterium RIFOXYA2_FULL_39_19]
MGCFLFSGIFWGAVLILLGISVILKVAFNINIPVFKIGVGLVFIYIGIRMITGGFFGQDWCCRTDRNSEMFGEFKTQYTPERKEYNVVFGKSILDLSEIKLQESPAAVKSSTVFGETIIKVKQDIPVMIIVSSAFAGAKMPDGTVLSFGNYTYKSKAYKDGEKFLKLEADVVFGSLVIEEN